MNKLVGYDCPLKRYPSPGVPIVRNFFGKYKAVYLNDDLHLDTEPVVATAEFYRLSDCDINLQKKLENFDYCKHRLFAISENHVEFYEVIDEIYFFIKLLSDKNFSKNDPFARVLLAKATGVNNILSQELQIYEQYLREYQKQLLPFWDEDKKELLDKNQGNEGISSQLNKIPVTGEKASEVGINYTNLRNLLLEKKEDEADKETEFLIKKLNEKVTKEKLKCFPVIDLHTIDKLWLISSGGYSGLSIQKKNGREGSSPRLKGCDLDLINIGDFDYAVYLMEKISIRRKKGKRLDIASKRDVGARTLNSSDYFRDFRLFGLVWLHLRRTSSSFIGLSFGLSLVIFSIYVVGPRSEFEKKQLEERISWRGVSSLQRLYQYEQINLLINGVAGVAGVAGLVQMWVSVKGKR